jgi:hypothetical protein
MAELFQTTPKIITLHLKSIYQESELDQQATCKEFLRVQSERKPGMKPWPTMTICNTIWKMAGR